MKLEDKFTKWLIKLKNSGKSDEEIGKILLGLAKYSGLETYNAIALSLTEDDINEIEAIQNDKKAKEKMEELFKKRTGMTIDKLVGKIQLTLIENSSYMEILKRN